MQNSNHVTHASEIAPFKETAQIFIEKITQQNSGAWKWPHYKRSFANDTFLQTDQGRKKSLSRFLSVILQQKWKPVLSAGFIEWKYYSVLSPEFHGIIGLSLYNPEVKFGKLAEGGLLLVIAGTVQSSKSSKVLPTENNDLSGEKESFVYMKLFPTKTLEGLGGSVLKASFENANFELEDASCSAKFNFQDGNDFMLQCSLTGEKKHSQWNPSAIFDRQLSPVPGSHWIVHNHVPVGQSTGSMKISINFIQNHKIAKFDANCFWTGFKSEDGQGTERSWTWSNAPAYFEHSYGLHPLPSQGWDFFFAPLKNSAGGATFQSYKNSSALKQLDIFWTDLDSGEKRKTSFKETEILVKWSKKEFDLQMRAWIPRERTFTGSNQSYEITLIHKIDQTLAFLRPQTPAVRCFFIGEQIGTASWQLKDKKGKVLVSTEDTLAGGEVAYARIPSLGKITCPFPVA